jgi:hypothetical protein
VARFYYNVDLNVGHKMRAGIGQLLPAKHFGDVSEKGDGNENEEERERKKKKTSRRRRKARKIEKSG